MQRNQLARESLLLRPHQNLPYDGLKYHNLALQGAVKYRITFKDYLSIILARSRIVPSLSAPFTVFLGGLTPFSAHLSLLLLTITTRPKFL